MDVDKDHNIIYQSNVFKIRRKERGKRSDSTHLTIYDLEKYEMLQDAAKLEGTNVSSIINNLYEDLLLKFDSPQTVLDMFEHEKSAPKINAKYDIWRKYLATLNLKEYKELDSQLARILNACNLRYDELLNRPSPAWRLAGRI